jgi:MFS family permease
MAINRMIFIVNVGFWKGITFFGIIIAIPISLLIAFKLKESPRFQQIQNYRAKKGKPSFKQQIKSVFQIEERKSYVTLLLISFIFGMGFFVTSTLIQKYVIDIGYTEAQLTTTVLMATFSVLISYGSNSVLVEKFGRKKMMIFYSLLFPIVGIGVVILPTVFFGTNQGFMLLIIFMFLTGFAGYGLNSLLRIYTLEFLPTKNRGTGLGLRTLAMAIGGTLGLFLSAPLILLITLGPTMIVLLCLCFIIVIIGMRVKETKGVDLSDIK